MRQRGKMHAGENVRIRVDFDFSLCENKHVVI